MSAYLYANRFGYGYRPGDRPLDGRMAAVQAGMLAGIAAFDPAPPALSALASRAELASALASYREEAMVQRAARQGQPDATTPAMERTPNPARRQARRSLRQHYLDAVHARALISLAGQPSFAERWVHFWSNHFAISVDKIAVMPFAGDYEFTAIRPNVFRSFARLLQAAVTHPAMLLFLDQAQSIGPASPLAQRVAQRRPDRTLGLNENLAREILELHTLGVRSGYTQADVRGLAEALTGHSIAGLQRGPLQRLVPADARPGDPVFIAAAHQPGAPVVLGRPYPQSGTAQLMAILSDLATHPATARHVATKVARHFIADDPPPAAVARLERSFLDSGGDLYALAHTLIESPEAWALAPAKFKTPWDWAISAMRALGVSELSNPQATAAMFDQLGQPVWRPGSPAGFADSSADWAGPQALADRVDLAERLAVRHAGQRDPRQLATAILADALDDASSAAISRADSPAQGLALMLVTPAFLRR